MDLSILSDLGLNKSEIKVYFALLELDSSSVGKIIKKSSISDSKIYIILNKLLEKGLVTYVIKKNIKHYQASNPNNFLKLIDLKQEKLVEQKKQVIEYLLPLIEKRKKKNSQNQHAVVYENYDGIVSAFDYLLEQVGDGGEYYSFMVGVPLENKKIINFFRNFHRKRIDNKIDVKILSNFTFKEIFNKKYDYLDMSIRYTNQNLPRGTFIFKDHVMIVVFDDVPTAFVIRSDKNYNYYKLFFEEMWDNSEK